jgi:hypothetical protein
LERAEEVLSFLARVFEAGRNGSWEEFESMHSPGYTRFSDLPPFRLQTREEALKLKLSLLTELIDLEYEFLEPRVVVMERFAVASLILRYRGMAVNDYAFEGRLVDTVVRCSIVLEKTENGWRILHEHLSRTPENFPP